MCCCVFSLCCCWLLNLINFANKSEKNWTLLLREQVSVNAFLHTISNEIYLFYPTNRKLKRKYQNVSLYACAHRSTTERNLYVRYDAKASTHSILVYSYYQIELFWVLSFIPDYSWKNCSLKLALIDSYTLQSCCSMHIHTNVDCAILMLRLLNVVDCVPSAIQTQETAMPPHIDSTNCLKLNCVDVSWCVRCGVLFVHTSLSMCWLFCIVLTLYLAFDWNFSFYFLFLHT